MAVPDQRGFDKISAPAGREAPTLNDPSSHQERISGLVRAADGTVTYNARKAVNQKELHDAWVRRSNPPPRPIGEPVPPTTLRPKNNIMAQLQGLSGNLMINHLSELDIKYNQAAPDINALEKEVDMKVKAMSETDPKRKILMEQFLALKQAHIQVQAAALHIRADLVAEMGKERMKQTAAQASSAKAGPTQRGNDQMELE